MLNFFRAPADDYTAVFTANATGALKLLGEAYPFGDRGRLLLCVDNHNSVNGIREFARMRRLPRRTCTLTSTRSSSNWTSLPAAQTGVGALLVRNDALAKLRRPWFAGGTITFSSVRALEGGADGFYLTPGAAGFEDGTINYLSIPAVGIGLRWLQPGSGAMRARPTRPRSTCCRRCRPAASWRWPMAPRRSPTSTTTSWPTQWSWPSGRSPWPSGPMTCASR